MDELRSYGDDAPFMALFGTPAKTKILAAFVAERGRDMSVTHLANLAGVARSTVYNHLDHFRDLGVVEQTRKMGGSPMFGLNDDSETAKKLCELEGITLKRLYELDDADK